MRNILGLHELEKMGFHVTTGPLSSIRPLIQDLRGEPSWVAMVSQIFHKEQYYQQESKMMILILKPLTTNHTPNIFGKH